MADDNVLKIGRGIKLSTVFNWLKEISQEGHPCQSKDDDGTISFYHKVEQNDVLPVTGTRLCLQLAIAHYPSHFVATIWLISDKLVIAEFMSNDLFISYHTPVPVLGTVNICAGKEFINFLETGGLGTPYAFSMQWHYVDYSFMDFGDYYEITPLSQGAYVKSAKKN